MDAPPQVSHSRQQLTPIPEIDLTYYADYPYRVQRALIHVTMVPCINSEGCDFRRFMIALPDLAMHLFPHLSLTACRAMLNALGLTLYRPNSTQLQVIQNSGKSQLSTRAGDNGVALVDLDDVIRLDMGAKACELAGGFGRRLP